MVLVNDGSRDNTLELLEKFRAEVGPAVVVLDKHPNAGKAEAVRYGINYAMAHFEPDFVGFWDADLATPLPVIHELLAIFVEYPQIEMVFGARVKLLGRQISRKVSRHYLGRVFATVVSNVLRLPVYDTQCGAKLFRATPDLKKVLQDPFLSRWIFDVEMIARYISNRGIEWVRNSIYEYPLNRWEDIAGSKVTAADFIKAAGDLVAIYKRYSSSR